MTVHLASAIAWPELAVMRVEVLFVDDPIAQPVQTSFGTMRSRPCLLVRITDDLGTRGVGEVWCNFPVGGARYKATLATAVIAPLLKGVQLAAPQEAFAQLDDSLAVMALQCADFGSLAQVIAAVDQAVWDLFAKRMGRPLWQLLHGRREVPVYASGIGPRAVSETITTKAREGHTRFKIKLGFGDEADMASLRDARAALPEGAALMVDVNQGWSLQQALAWMPRLVDLGIVWCEEPLRADTPWDAWRGVADAAGPMRIAGGENLMGLERFQAAMHKGGLRVLQPDLGKWGGLSLAFDIDRALTHDTWLCPHWLAGGVGLMASLQFKAASVSPGWVEVDANPNARRTFAFAQQAALADGTVILPVTPGAIPALAPMFGDDAGWTDAFDG